MTVRKIDGGYLVDVRPNGRSGKRFIKKFLRVKGHTKTDAEAYHAHVMAENQRDPDWKPKKKDSRRLMQLVNQWQELHGSKLRDQWRLATVKNTVEGLRNPMARELTASDFIRYGNRRINDKDHPVTPNTVNHELSYLKAVYNKLIELDEWAHGNPLAKVPKWKTPDNELSYLTSKQIDKLLTACDASNNRSTRLCAELCLDTGARWGEAETVKVSQIRNGRVSYYNTKGGKPRPLPITRELEKRLLAHAEENGREDGRVFNGCYQAFCNALKRSKIKLPKGQAAHVLRHTFASHFVMNGGNILALQRILGHSDIKMTLRYAHLAPDFMQETLKFRPLRKG